MKTKERILETSLLLFNEEGEANVTTVDVANEMEISPGNLYYHYRGKEVIIEALYDQFDREMTEILSAPIENSVSLEDSWLYLYVVLEQIYNYRFIYFNLTDIMGRYEKLQRRFKRLLKLKTNTTRSLCDDLIANKILSEISESQFSSLCDQVVMTLIYWFSFNSLNDRKRGKAEILMHEGVFQIMSILAPHLASDKKEFFDECKDLYRELIKKAELDLD